MTSSTRAAALAVLLGAAALVALGSCTQARSTSAPALSAPAAPAPAAPAPAAPAPAASDPATSSQAPLSAIAQQMVNAGLAVPKSPLASVDFELPSLGGGTTKLSSLHGSVVMLNFWATWCPPCRSEMPSMQRLYQQFRGKGLVVLAVDLQEQQDQVQKFVAENGLSFPVLLDATGQVGVTYGAQSIPTTWIVDRSGGIVARAVGGREWDTPEMLSIFQALLQQP
jgi:thiol-disulfide isomerase/thioredoxin